MIGAAIRVLLVNNVNYGTRNATRNGKGATVMGWFSKSELSSSKLGIVNTLRLHHSTGSSKVKTKSTTDLTDDLACLKALAVHGPIKTILDSGFRFLTRRAVKKWGWRHRCVSVL